MLSKSPYKVVLVGPTNVGKSTLFNRLTHTRKAIVCDRPGVTVDRHELDIDHDGLCVRIIDTGGVGPTAKEHPLGAEIEKAAAAAVASADLIFFVVDGTKDASNEEGEIASWLRRQPKKVTKDQIYLVANKVDTKKFDPSSYYALGFSDPIAISAEHGTGMSEIWSIIDKESESFSQEQKVLDAENDEIYSDEFDLSSEDFLEEDQEDLDSLDIENEDLGSEVSESNVVEAAENFVKKVRSKRRPKHVNEIPRVIVIGRPNVGKSTLINTLIRQDRHVVSDIPGTTRDVIASDFETGGMKWTLLDSAGMRRPGRLERGVEWVATQKLKEEAKKSDLALVVVDSSEGITDLDASIAGLASDLGLGVVLVFNKWDKMEGTQAEDRVANFERTKDLKLDFLRWAPSVNVSGLSGKGVPKLIETLKRVHESRATRVKTAKLNDLFEQRIRHHSHPIGPNSKPAKFYYISQVSSSPPEFVLFSNIPGSHVHFSYKRFLINALRGEFGFEGTPIKIHFKQAR